MRTGVLAVALALTCGGCILGGNESTPFPPGLEPLEPSTAPAPLGTPADPFPEAIEVLHGDNGEYMWVHTRGFVHASTAKVWLALQNADVIADRRNVDSHSQTLGVEPEYPISFQMSYFVDDVLNVEWDENWRLGPVEGTLDAPDVGAVRFQKVFGSVFIKLLEGSIIIRFIDDDITEIETVEHLDAIMTESSRPAQYHRDMFANILAHVRGLPQPEY